MTCAAPRIVNSISCSKRIDHDFFFRGRRRIWRRWRMTRAAPRMVNSVSCSKRIDPEFFFAAGAAFGDVGE